MPPKPGPAGVDEQRADPVVLGRSRGGARGTARTCRRPGRRSRSAPPAAPVSSCSSNCCQSIAPVGSRRSISTVPVDRSWSLGRRRPARCRRVVGGVRRNGGLGVLGRRRADLGRPPRSARRRRASRPPAVTSRKRRRRPRDGGDVSRASPERANAQLGRRDGMWRNGTGGFRRGGFVASDHAAEPDDAAPTRRAASSPGRRCRAGRCGGRGRSPGPYRGAIAVFLVAIVRRRPARPGAAARRAGDPRHGDPAVRRGDDHVAGRRRRRRRASATRCCRSSSAGRAPASARA